MDRLLSCGRKELADAGIVASLAGMTGQVNVCQGGPSRVEGH
jgi:hypothetical protein